MNIKVQLLIETESGKTEVLTEVAQLQRESLQPETLGLTLAEAKTLLNGLQQTLVEQQVAQYLEHQSTCSHCQRKLKRKGDRTIVYRTLFGKLHLRGTRLWHCPCQPDSTESFSPLSDLLPERTAPELFYLESKFASLMSYGLSVKLLEEVLPIGETLNPTTVRNHLQQIAQRLEGELGDEEFAFIEGCERDLERLPRPDLPLTVGLDGGYVHSCESQSSRVVC